MIVHIDIKTGSHIEIKVDKHVDKKTGLHKDKHTYRHKYRHTCVCLDLKWHGKLWQKFDSKKYLFSERFWPGSTDLSNFPFERLFTSDSGYIKRRLNRIAAASSAALKLWFFIRIKINKKFKTRCTLFLFKTVVQRQAKRFIANQTRPISLDFTLSWFFFRFQNEYVLWTLCACTFHWELCDVNSRHLPIMHTMRVINAWIREFINEIFWLSDDQPISQNVLNISCWSIQMCQHSLSKYLFSYSQFHFSKKFFQDGRITVNILLSKFLIMEKLCSCGQGLIILDDVPCERPYLLVVSLKNMIGIGIRYTYR